MAVIETSQIVTLSSAPSTEWDVVNPTLPEGMLGYASDVKKVKVGNGLTTWTNLPYIMDETILAQHVDLLERANQANGVCVLSDTGIIPLDRIPAQALEHVKYVANIAARNSIPIADRTCLVIVLDAAGDIIAASDAIAHTVTTIYDEAAEEVTAGGVAFIDFGALIGTEPEDFDDKQQGDITVKVSGAVYTWNGTATNGMWTKISEFESLDIAFDVYFNMITETLTNINDGVNFIKFTTSERGRLAISLSIDDIHLFRGLTPVQLKTATE